MRCLDAIARRARARCPSRPRCSCSTTPRATARPARARRHAVATEVIALEQRARARARTTPRCSSARAGATRCCSTRTPSCAPARSPPCTRRSSERRDAAAAGARLLRPDGAPQPSAWRFPTPRDGARRRAVPAPPPHRAEPRASARARSTGRSPPRCSCAPRRPREIGWFDPAFFVYSDEVDFCKRLRDAGWRTLYVPAAVARPPRAALDRHGARAADRRALAQPRPLHAQAPLASAAAAVVRVLTAWAYAVRSLAALALPGHDPRRYWRHVTRDAAPGPRRGPARGRGRAQPRPPAVDLSAGSPCPRARRPTTASRSCRCPGRWSGRGRCRRRSSRAGGRRR